ncbi:MAG: PHP domain-containing protein [Fusobacteriaceae bacterium]
MKHLDISPFFKEFYTTKDPKFDFYLDLHLHTIDSDGVITPENIAVFLKDKNYLLAVADHNEISGCKKLLDLGINVVPAIELGCQDGFEILVYFKNFETAEIFFSKEVAPFKHPTRMSRTTRDIFTYLELLKEYDVHLSIPHINGLAQKNFIKNKNNIFKVVRESDSLETYNHALPKKNNSVAKSVKKIYNKNETWGSDAHTMREIKDYLLFLHKKKTVLKSILNNIGKIGILSSIGLKHLNYLLKSKY